jgi:hypothetical protein
MALEKQATRAGKKDAPSPAAALATSNNASWLTGRGFLIGRVDIPSGLTPGFVIVDLDVLHQAAPDLDSLEGSAFHIPRRTRILSPARWRTEVNRLRKEQS